MNVLVWLTEATWAACVDAARAWSPADAEIALLFVIDDDAAAIAHGGFAGLLGRSRPPERDPGTRVEALSTDAADELLAQAARRLARPASTARRHGRPEDVVVAATIGADLLICGRDGDLRRVGPHSLGRATRFVVDHASSPVLLVWPEPPAETEPPSPPHTPRHRPHEGGHRPPGSQ